MANRVGFANQSHFTHSFKQLTGLTPNQFRKSC
ncbi:MAG: AraC family transcriptional regulator [Chloroflexota bacterium]